MFGFFKPAALLLAKTPELTMALLLQELEWSHDL